MSIDVAVVAAIAVLCGVVGGYAGIMVSRLLGLYGQDVFKPWRRERVPETGAFGVAVALSVLYAVLHTLYGDNRLLAASALLAINALIGLVDDVYRMDPITKPLATMASASVLALLDAMPKRVFIPYFGWASVPVIYLAAAPVLVGVSANALNMMDVVNGVMPTVASLVALTLAVSHILMVNAGLLSGVDVAGLTLAVSLAAALASYLLLFNRYPARCFNGDSGSLPVGALLGYLAATLHQEIVYLVAISPLILNGFQIVATVRGFAERREIPRPTRVDEKGRIHAVCNPSTPPTLVQMLTLREPLTELEVYTGIAILEALSCIIAVASAALIYGFTQPGL